MGRPQGTVRTALSGLVTGVAGVALTTAIGSAVVGAVFTPMANASFALQWLAVFGLMAAESAAVHLPSEVVLPAAGWLVVRDHGLGIGGIVALSAWAAAANTFGSGALYIAGRAGGRPLIRRYGRWVLLHEHTIDATAQRIARHSWWALFATRLLPVVRTYVGFAAGLLRVPPTTFLAATYCGSFLWCLAFVTLGVALGSHSSVIRGQAEVLGITGIVITALVLTAVWWSRQRTGTA